MSKKQEIMNVAVLGAGFGGSHVGGILNHPERFRLRWLCDLDEARSRKCMEKFEGKVSEGFRFGGDYRTALEDPEVQAVAVSMPHHLHEKVCVEAAQAGKHIMLDKPIARTLAEADKIIAAADANKVTLMVAFNYRFTPFYVKMRELVAEGLVGRPLFALTRHYQCFNPPPNANWRSKASTGGGCVIGSGVHNIDFMRWLLGEPEEVFAYGVEDPARLDAEAAASISFRYPGGLVVSFCCLWVCSGATTGVLQYGEWEVYGSTGDLGSCDGELRLGRLGQKVESLGKFDGGAFERMWPYFQDCVANGSAPMTNGPDARKTLALVLNVQESIETGRPVRC